MTDETDREFCHLSCDLLMLIIPSQNGERVRSKFNTLLEALIEASASSLEQWV